MLRPGSSTTLSTDWPTDQLSNSKLPVCPADWPADRLGDHPNHKSSAISWSDWPTDRTKNEDPRFYQWRESRSSSHNPTNRPTDRPTDRPIVRPTDRLTDRPTNRVTDSPMNRSTDQPRHRKQKYFLKKKKIRVSICRYFPRFRFYASKGHAVPHIKQDSVGHRPSASSFEV